jgi:hypothetical protein
MVDLVQPHTKTVIYMATLHLYGLQVSSECGVTAFMSGNSAAHLSVICIYPGLQSSNLNMAATDLLLGTLNLEVLFGRLSICERGPLFGK